ncbi:MAG TPA: CvpA family protein [Planctomycetota bacterium]|nr:CvpA family protein [Planctomycetota bacterium]
MLFDGLVVIVVALAAAFGAWKGFARLAAGVLSPVVGIAAGWPLSAELPSLHRWLAFGLLYVLITLVVFGIAALARRRLERARLEGWDHHLGLVFGAVEGGVLAIALTLLALSISGDLHEKIMASHAGSLMAQAIQELRPLLGKGAAAILDPWFDLLQRRNS